MSEMLPVHVMVAAACTSYGGYEFVRAASVSLFLTEIGSQHLPLAFFGVAVTSYAMVQAYRVVLKRSGASLALRISCWSIAAFFMLSAIILGWMTSPDANLDYRISTFRKCVVAAAFIVRQAYVTFLASQQFSFIVSLLHPNKASDGSGPAPSTASSLGNLYGITSIVSALSAYIASLMTNPYISMFLASLALIVSSLISDASYCMAAKNPEFMLRLKDDAIEAKNQSHTSSKDAENECEKARRSSKCKFTGVRSILSSLLPSIFQEHRSLLVLFIVTIIMQAVSSLLGLAYASSLEKDLISQEERSSFIGKFHFCANGLSSLVQFFGLRMLFARLGLSTLVAIQPVILLIVITFAFFFPGLRSSSIAALVFKVMEYSLWSGTKDLTFMMLNFEARFVAKEFVDVFGYRSGKAGMAILLFVIGLMTGHTLNSHYLYGIAGLLCIFWLTMAIEEKCSRINILPV